MTTQTREKKTEMKSFFKSEDKSVLIILALAALFYSFRQYSAETIIVRLFIIVCCIPIHEYAHAKTAYLLGDETAQQQGRVTLNPMAHLTVEGALLIFVFGFGYGKPVPVGTYNFPLEKRKKYYAFTALAGPLSNLIMSVLFSFIGIISFYQLHNATVYQYLSYASYININLAVFNMLPIPPLDGSSLLNLILPESTYYKLCKYRKTLITAIFAMTWILPRFGINILGTITGKIYSSLFSLLSSIISRFV